MDRGPSSDSEYPTAADSSSSPSDSRHYEHQQQQQQRARSLNDSAPAGFSSRFGSALRSVSHTFHLFQRHQVVEHSAAAMAAAAVAGGSGASPAQRTPSVTSRQSGALRKLTGAGLLSRFRSSSKAMSDEEMEGPTARGMGIVSHPANCVKSSPILFQTSDPARPDDAWQRLDQSADDAKATSDPTSVGYLPSLADGGSGGGGQHLINGNTQQEAAHLTSATLDDAPHLSAPPHGADSPRTNGAEQDHPIGDGIGGAGAAPPSPMAVSSASPHPPSSGAHPHHDLDSDGVRVYKKVSTNGKLTLYLINRDMIINKESVTPLHAVVTVDDDELRNRKIFAQILLTFRYGRDDEEVMGLKLSNESILCVEQVYPPLPGTSVPKPLTKCQEVLMKRLGPNAHCINLKLNHTVPASVRLLPAKEYRGAAIGISYDLRVFTAESIEEKPHRRSQVRMAIRLVQYAPIEIQQTDAPHLSLEKHFLLREGTMHIDAALERQWYTQGSPITVGLRIHNRSSRIVKKIQIRAIQHVDVTMFSNGKFKNTIATLEETDGLPLTSGCTLERHYPLTLMENGAGRHWVALEDRYGRLTATLASTTLKSAPNERHFFAIYISYYVKVRLVVSGVGGDVAIKIPFILMRDGPEPGPIHGDHDEVGVHHTSPDHSHDHHYNQIAPRPSVTDQQHASGTTAHDKNQTANLPEDMPAASPVDQVCAELHPEPKESPSNDQDNTERTGALAAIPGLSGATVETE